MPFEKAEGPWELEPLQRLLSREEFMNSGIQEVKEDGGAWAPLSYFLDF